MRESVRDWELGQISGSVTNLERRLKPEADWWKVLNKEGVKANCYFKLTASKLVILFPKDGRAPRRETGQCP